MPPEAQTRLLRVLQEGEFTSVGGRQPIRANVRIIAATHRDLRAGDPPGAVPRGSVLPPQRGADPPAAAARAQRGHRRLARHFLDRARADGLPAKTLDGGAVEALRGYRWPGNVRELENLMRRLAALCPDEVIGAAAVRAELADAAPPPGAEAPAAERTPASEPLARAVERHIRQFLAAHHDGIAPSDIYDRVLAEVERPLIQLTLAATRGNQIKAAAMLGLNRNTLRKKIRDLEIPVVRGIA